MWAMRRFIALVVLVAFGQIACYNTYYIPRAELKKLQQSESHVQTVKDLKGRSVVVKDTTRLFVRSRGGKRYQLTPFNFKLTERQLVASDRDYILDVQEIERNAEIDMISTWKTAVWIGLGAAALAGLIFVTVLSARSTQAEQ